jgi:DNA-binding transcriptional ArsR family regulator
MKKSVDPDVRLLQALADPTRLAILRQLSAQGPVCACDFTACCDVAQPTVSHHLKVLREAGWVDAERRGTWIWYAIRPDALERLARIAGGLRVGEGATAGLLGGDRATLPIVVPPPR